MESIQDTGAGTLSNQQLFYKEIHGTISLSIS